MYNREKILFVIPAAPGFYVLSPCYDEAGGAICEASREPVVGWALDALGSTIPVTPHEVLNGDNREKIMKKTAFIAVFAALAAGCVTTAPREELAKALADFQRQAFGSEGEPHPDLPKSIVLLGDEAPAPAIRERRIPRLTYRQLEKIAEDFEDALRQVGDVGRTKRVATVPETVYLDYSTAKLAELRVSAQDLAGAVARRNAVVPGGTPSNWASSRRSRPSRSGCTLQSRPSPSLVTRMAARCPAGSVCMAAAAGAVASTSVGSASRPQPGNRSVPSPAQCLGRRVVV